MSAQIVLLSTQARPVESTRASMLRQFAGLSKRQQMGLLVIAMQVYAEGVTPDGMVLRMMCKKLTECDRARPRRSGRKGAPA
jgi:hypothetical protein